MIDEKSSIHNNCNISQEAEILESEIGSETMIDKYTRVWHSTLANKVMLEQNNLIVYSRIGRYSYTGVNTVIKNAEIGSFNSIAWNVSIGGNTHDMNHITTHSFLVYSKWGMGGNGNWKSASEKCVIGNDVWIGAGVNVLRNVTIGNGAIIGAGTVVTKDVPPYTIVAGNPGKIIRLRCKEEYIEKLQELKWWEFPEDIIRQNFNLFQLELTTEVIDQLIQIKENIK